MADSSQDIPAHLLPQLDGYGAVVSDPKVVALIKARMIDILETGTDVVAGRVIAEALRYDRAMRTSAQTKTTLRQDSAGQLTLEQTQTFLAAMSGMEMPGKPLADQVKESLSLEAQKRIAQEPLDQVEIDDDF